ncbi:putative bifunctional diguanylate cyclase/phosphodiesterase [Marinimicrobium locisalis]|uniref:putative bifunctional diguanylate cyclase/phosphodiesterase n=1 Tax=Marinimicrobium locisalis TaxID=546022 RepID=UPI003221DB1C
MSRIHALHKPVDWHLYRLFDLPLGARIPWCLAAVAVLLAVVTYLVYSTGGTAYAYPYLTLIPVLFAAAWFGLAGGVISALVAGALMGAMPLDVERGISQPLFNWVLRIGLYLLIGGVAGWLFQSLRQAFRERERIVRADPRSGLPNQVALEQDLQRWLIDSYAQREPLSLLIVRMSDATDILEAMGADASDELIARLGQRLKHLVEPLGKVYRFSESEIAIPVKDCGSVRLSALVRTIVEAGEENLQVKGVPVRVQLVLGASTTDVRLRPPESDHRHGAFYHHSLDYYRQCLDTLLSEARIALLAAIERHLSYCRFDPALKRKTQTNLQLIARVRQALDRNEFELHYQPKIRLRDEALDGCECLIRWRDNRRKMIPPDHFMPKVEATTLIAPVTEFVSQQGCQFIRRFQGPTSINFSSRNLVDERLLNYVERLVSRCAIDPELVEIEVTESALIHNLDAARQGIERLRGFGFKVSIDDFGTGFASFDYLRRLPITGLKIDRAFVTGIDTNERSRKLIGCMIDLGHALDLTVTAEGVETQAQLKVLKALGCDLGQGFLFAKAMPGPVFMQWCARYRPLVGPDH